MDIKDLKDLSYSCKQTLGVFTPFSTANNKDLSVSSIQNKPGEDLADAMHAVKLDPAVLDVQVANNPINNNKVTKSNQERKALAQCAPAPLTFERMMLMQKTALLSLTPYQFELLMKFTDTLRQQRRSIQRCLECAFCKNNGEAVSWYSMHILKDNRGRVRCPILRNYTCPLCGATGQRAHTIKYCPENFKKDQYDDDLFCWPSN
ncbi:uncharacterized protein LOC131845139 [Achroia grisella]|uniref:uncharacterized protein LOC131845139 n=1 Tax=Achroia grisella TaxID=688607 RepID=UPI0027D28E1D|nr:uncharacterized protein LOC131845139 [Achroia grisella]